MTRDEPTSAQEAGLAALTGLLDTLLLRDRHVLERRLERLGARGQKDQPIDRALAQIRESISASQAEVERRRALVPPVSFPDTLPISARREDIARLIATHPVTIVCGDTGSGKSTQLPKLCLSLGRGVRGRIAHTQPRRIAARAIAARVGEELGRAGLVGYKMRFEDRTGPDTLVKVVTDGILLQELRGDPMLLEYDTVIVDEAHERSLNVDLILGTLRRILPKRPELRVIITSATIEPQRFADFFGGAPIVDVSGRSFPVELRYRPVADQDEEPEAVLAAVAELERDESWHAGDVLVFLAGERAIRDTATTLTKSRRGIEVLPLYARLSAAEQDRVFRPSGRPRIVLATNIAETSLTVPGVTAVIDAGTARIDRYSARTKIQRLPVEPVSRASADQRAGRCGRIAPGICIRLYDEEDFAARPAQTDPEILRVHLAEVILQMADLGLGRVEDFPFIDPPDARQLRDGFRLLVELGAVDEDNRITALGHDMARLPIDPRLARMLLAAAERHCLKEMLVVTSALSVRDPRTRPAEHTAQADRRHAQFAERRSDLLGWLALWAAYREQRRTGRGALRRWCQREFMSYPRLQEWHDVQAQLLGLVRDLGLQVNRRTGASDALHRAALTGLLDRVGRREDRFDYAGARGLKFRIFPGSALYGRAPRWIVAAEIVETARTWARNVAAIRRAWLEEAGAHLLKRSYFDPHWHAARGRVEAFERATLYGVAVYEKRRVHYGPIAPEEARSIFIREGLVAGEGTLRAPFAQHNRKLRKRLLELEARTRRREISAGPPAVAAFYETRIPEGMCTLRAFDRWRRRAERENPKLLFLREDDLVASPAALARARGYPEQIELGGNALPVQYHFAPGDTRLSSAVSLTVMTQYSNSG